MTPPLPQPRLDERGLPEGYHFREGWEVTPREVKRMLDAGEDVVVIDCRTPQEYEHVRLEGVPHLQLVPVQQAMARLEELRALADKKVVVHCHHGGRSLQMTAFMRQQGIPDTHSMAGGLDLWAIDIEPGMKRY